MDKEFNLNADYIELVKLLKIFGIGNTGGQAKQIISAGLVRLNGVTEYRVRAKLRKDDLVEVDDLSIRIK